MSAWSANAGGTLSPSHWFMAQYKPSQRVKPEAVLQSVRTHCLFPQAEACIKHRLPKLEGIEGGPNPWAAMALMLVLCDGVGDVLDLVVCLRGCLLSASAITEYLSAMATMLLAMRRKDINISNRWHYNIFYVLHLIENALPTAITNQREPRFRSWPSQAQGRPPPWFGTPSRGHTSTSSI
ncbi:hypothetical protein J4Q44_G00143910 [Coregonus suidteri]|uniref:Uncharacterized protein n=1 Tax=Coregonus suidteri TaxID=861788 RepID=A0AAN8LV23_9TELE